MPVRLFGTTHFVPACHEKQNQRAVTGRDLAFLPLADDLEIVFVDDATREAGLGTGTC